MRSSNREHCTLDAMPPSCTALLIGGPQQVQGYSKEMRGKMENTSLMTQRRRMKSIGAAFFLLDALPDVKTHPSPLCPLCNIHTHNKHHFFNCTHICTTCLPLNLWTDPAEVTALLARWTEKLAGGPQVGTLDFPPTSKGHWSG